MEKLIRKINEERILRVKMICGETISFIEEWENRLMGAKLSDNELLNSLSDWKVEVNSICQKYVGYVEECTEDLVSVSPELIERVKVQTGNIKKRLLNHPLLNPEDEETASPVVFSINTGTLD